LFLLKYLNKQKNPDRFKGKMNFLILLFISTSLAVLPECRFACDDPVCNAICGAMCDPPNCTSTDPQCVVSCATRCNETVIDTDSPPSCVTRCDPCAMGSIQCAALNCGWVCEKGETCAQPRCELQCEMPAFPFHSLISSGSRIAGVGLGIMLVMLVL
jgi:hypothetical protein